MSIDKSIDILATEASRKWVERVVVGLGLCPFASQPLLEERVRFACCPGTTMEEILQALMAEVSWLEADEGPQTTLLIIPHGMDSFDDFVDLMAAAEDLLEITEKSESFQLAHFHPDYCFEGADPADLANHTNRSPHPMLHLLRVADVAEAIASHGDTESIPVRNVARMRNLGAEGLARLLA